MSTSTIESFSAHRYSSIVVTLENITVVLETSGSRMVQQVHVFAGEVLVQLQGSEQANKQTEPEKMKGRHLING